MRMRTLLMFRFVAPLAVLTTVASFDARLCAQTLVKDLDPSQIATNPDSNPQGFCVVNGIAYFAASGPGTTGTELWRSDGTAAGTWMVKDINLVTTSVGPVLLTEFNGELAFTADDGINGRELWLSDGTTAGTRRARGL